MNDRMREVHVVKSDGGGTEPVSDRVAVEEPLEIRLRDTALAVVMRTPGDDTDLVTGFFLTEAIILEPAEIAHSPTDETYPPNRSLWGGNIMVDYMNLGPVADTSTIGYQLPYGSRQQIGNFLFVVDKSNNQVRVVNSNTMETITRLTSGLSQPDSAVVTTDLKNLYVKLLTLNLLVQ